MKELYRNNFLPCRCETVGFALFLAWVFCTLFGCGLATHESWIDGTFTSYNLERIWMVSGLFEACGGLAGLLVARFAAGPRRLAGRRAFGLTACACAVAGSVLIWYAWTDRFGAAWAFYVPGGALSGFAVAQFSILWSKRLSSFDEAHIEFAVPLSFTLAFALYSVMLFTKRGSLPFLALLLALIVGSTLLSYRKSAHDQPSLQLREEAALKGGPREALASFCALSCASWIQVSFFRVVSTPAVMGSRMSHFLIPFASACALSLVMLALCLRHSRYLNVSLAYRWSLPLFMLSYVPLILDYGNPTLRGAAYAVNFLGMFGVQFGCWLGACKYLRRQGGRALFVFGAYVFGEGLGIFMGCCLGLIAVALGEREMLVMGTFVLACVLFTVMATGFNPRWVLNRTSNPARIGNLCTSGSDADLNLDAAFQQSARTLQKSYDLTNRETDVAALLLAGRSRPYIRDELTVSINTVGSHVRSIFAKCGVHSQQELMDLARGRRLEHSERRQAVVAPTTQGRARAGRSESAARRL